MVHSETNLPTISVFPLFFFFIRVNDQGAHTFSAHTASGPIWGPCVPGAKRVEREILKRGLWPHASLSRWFFQRPDNIRIQKLPPAVGFVPSKLTRALKRLFALLLAWKAVRQEPPNLIVIVVLSAQLKPLSSKSFALTQSTFIVCCTTTDEAWRESSLASSSQVVKSVKMPQTFKASRNTSCYDPVLHRGLKTEENRAMNRRPFQKALLHVMLRPCLF